MSDEGRPVTVYLLDADWDAIREVAEEEYPGSSPANAVKRYVDKYVCDHALFLRVKQRENL